QVEALIEEGNGAPRCGLERFPLRDLLGDRLRDQLADGSPPLSREDLRLPDGLPIEADCQVLLGLHCAHTRAGWRVARGFACRQWPRPATPPPGSPHRPSRSVTVGSSTGSARPARPP